MLQVAQLRAARALLGWRQEDIAQAAKLALQPFGVLKAKKGRWRSTFQLWSKFRRHSNTPESNSSTMTSWAASAFGWQRRKESDDVKPLVSTKIFGSRSSNPRSIRSSKTSGRLSGVPGP